MTVLKIAGIFTVAALGEVAGTYAIWRWRRLSGPAWLLLAGALALVGYACGICDFVGNQVSALVVFWRRVNNFPVNHLGCTKLCLCLRNG